MNFNQMVAMMLSIYFLLVIFGLSIIGFLISLIFVYRWWEDDRGGLSALIAIVMFFISCLSGTHAFWRLEASDKVIINQKMQ